jgi:hypothetical protein
MIRHITSADNVSEGRILNPEKVRHGIVTAMRIAELSGWVDPSTHLNIDFPGHRLQAAVVAERLAPGARILESETRMMYALVEPSAFRHYGAVNTLQRADELRQAVKAGRSEGKTGITG